MTEDGFERAVAEHKDRVHGYAAWLLRDREEARDVSQEALVRLWQNRERVDEAAARNWLLRTTHNLSLDRIRRRSARREVEVEPLGPAIPDGNPGPDRSAAAGEIGDILERALIRLSPRDRAVVLLREVQGMAYEEIAQILGLPLGTLKAILHRSREKLRVELTRAGVAP